MTASNSPVRLRAALRKRLRAPGSPDFQLDARLEAAAGITLLFGPSGAGKSTLLDLLAGLQRPDDGRMELAANGGAMRPLFDSAGGVDVSVSERSIAYVFQGLALFPHLTVEDNVSYGLAHLDAAGRARKTRAILESFHIAPLARRRPHEISGGERQRAALARSLVTEPHLLLLDEPLTALDARTKRKILDDLLAWNAARRIPILYVTHSRAEALALADRVLVMEQGSVVAGGAPAEVLAKVEDF